MCLIKFNDNIAKFTAPKKIKAGQRVVVDSNQVAHPVPSQASGRAGIVLGEIETHADGTMTALILLD